MKVEIVHVITKDLVHTIEDVSIYTTIEEIKAHFQNAKPHLSPVRQSFRKEPRGKPLEDDVTLRSLEFESVARLYFKDLGPQVAWKTVFLTEYTGPFIIYLIFYLRPSIIYGADARNELTQPCVHTFCAAYLFHYAKRVLETHFVHRFSHGTMPIMNIFKNCLYYWGFTCLIAYYINHPLYTAPLYGNKQVYFSLAAFLTCQLGNYSIHKALRDLRPEGSKERKIPVETGNPFTLLFNFVSCPNYTYEIGSWFWFAVMTQSVMPGVFALLGTAQMTQWALKKHKAYRREFKDYPKRKAIIPFII